MDFYNSILSGTLFQQSVTSTLFSQSSGGDTETSSFAQILAEKQTPARMAQETTGSSQTTSAAESATTGDAASDADSLDADSLDADAAEALAATDVEVQLPEQIHLVIDEAALPDQLANKALEIQILANSLTDAQINQIITENQEFQAQRAIRHSAVLDTATMQAQVSTGATTSGTEAALSANTLVQTLTEEPEETSSVYEAAASVQAQPFLASAEVSQVVADTSSPEAAQPVSSSVEAAEPQPVSVSDYRVLREATYAASPAQEPVVSEAVADASPVLPSDAGEPIQPQVLTEQEAPAEAPVLTEAPQTSEVVAETAPPVQPQENAQPSFEVRREAPVEAPVETPVADAAQTEPEDGSESAQFQTGGQSLPEAEVEAQPETAKQAPVDAAVRSAQPEAAEETEEEPAEAPVEAPVFDPADGAIPVKVAEPAGEAQSPVPLESDGAAEALAARALESVESGEQICVVQLEPASLGSIQMSISRDADGILHLVMEAVSPKTMALLEKHADSIQNIMAQNVSEEVRVEVRNEPGQPMPENWTEQDKGQQQQQQQRNPDSQEDQSTFLNKLRLGLLGSLTGEEESA